MANITVSPRSTHPATYVQIAGVTMAGMGPLLYALSVDLISMPGWASLRYFADVLVQNIAPFGGMAMLLLSLLVGFVWVSAYVRRVL